ncbi:carboxylating nicotinate-nucleotide diphosphorylase [Teredinibacter haidensis]|uniref:carboxylating nicotinate-nucleotide diphosphorylase n=1 Tax=Teredinibacter haidensis TaxID=2731755 RepID=UPI000A551B92|nr:carboxylating nicotinate-nucleotide diphosphorylase [Teredinibacter haidensis]
MNLNIKDIQKDIEQTVTQAIEEDVGSGDITAQLIEASKTNTAEVITREDCTICGIAWVDEVYRQIGGINSIRWQVADGEKVTADTTLFTIEGNTRSLLTGERTALNFLQLLSGIATKASQYAQLVADTSIKILDTRKTIPGLRTAQKYAVACGGCHNHRIGLFDAFLIKENHISACGGIEQAIKTAKEIAPGKPVEVEVETLEELNKALSAGADIIMLDNFSANMLEYASNLERTAKFEISGNVTSDQVAVLKQYNVDYISTGDLTKNCGAIDLSMRFNSQ